MGAPHFFLGIGPFLGCLKGSCKNTKPEYKDVTVPYWDWTNAESNNAVWGSELMGGDGRESDGRVMDGAFAYDSANWKLYTAPSLDPQQYAREDLSRRFGFYKEDGQQFEINLPTAEQVSVALETNPYDNPPWISDRTTGQPQPSFRNRLEGNYGAGSIHNIVHVWVGGMIIETNPSPPPPEKISL